MKRYAQRPGGALGSRSARPRLERLEARATPTVLTEAGPNDTLDLAQSLGDLSTQPEVTLLGTVGGADGPADVDWSRFTLDRAAAVVLTATGDAAPVLGLYNSAPFDFGDPFNPVHNRQLGQTADGATPLEFVLGAGTYFAAVSGRGNRYFHPYLAGSGSAGGQGGYALTVRATALPAAPTAGPVVLGTEPGAGTALTASPFAVRVAFDKPLDFGTVIPDQSARLIYNPTGTFADGTDTPVALMGYNLSPSGRELQLFPAAALKPGFYAVILAGDTSAGAAVLADLAGVPLGADDAHPNGRDFTSTFQISGVEGRAASDPTDDTPPNARELGTLTPDTLVQLAGAVGDDPYFDPANPDAPLNPSADVDLYHFRIAGPGRFAFSAEAFAGRIGSPLDPGLSLFRLHPATGRLVFVAGNNNTGNGIAAADGTLPLCTDPALFTGLTAGDYYLAVSSNYNTPTTVEGGQPGENGIFDPTVSHSGSAGFSTGPYVLTLAVHPDADPPAVVATAPAAGATLDAPPTRLVVEFTEVMNLRALFFLAYEQTSQQTVSAVFIEGADGVRYFPRLLEFDAATNRATFLMLDGLANGDYTLHLSGALGLTDLAGNPLPGNDPSGDFVVPFAVAGAPRGVNGDPLIRAAETTSEPDQPQDLGLIFPHEFQAGVLLARAADPAAGDTADAFRFEVIQGQTYGLNLSGAALPAGIFLELVDDAGNLAEVGSADDGRTLTALLNPGVYVLRVRGWAGGDAGALAYEVRFTLLGASDNAPALTVGPAAAVQLRLVGPAPTPAADTTPPVNTTVALSPPVVTPTAPTVPVVRAPDPFGADPAVDPAAGLVPASRNADSDPAVQAASTGGSGMRPPSGLLAPLAAPPLGGGVVPLSGPAPDGVSRVSIDPAAVFPPLLAAAGTFLVAPDPVPPTAAAPVPTPVESPPVTVRPPAAETPPDPAIEAPRLATESGPEYPLAPVAVAVPVPVPAPAPVPVPAACPVADSPVCGPAEPSDQSDRTWGAALAALAAPVVFLWRRASTRGRFRRESLTEV